MASASQALRLGSRALRSSMLRPTATPWRVAASINGAQSYSTGKTAVRQLPNHLRELSLMQLIVDLEGDLRRQASSRD